MGRLPGYTPSKETKGKIIQSMKERMALKFPVENRRGFVKKRKGPTPFTPEQRELARERKNAKDRVRRKNKWYGNVAASMEGK